MKKEITWLHLSDFHIGNAHTKKYLEKFFLWLEKDANELCRDEFSNLAFVLLSGDLANKGEVGEYKEFRTKVLGRIDSITGKRLPILMVPGNHDISRPKSSTVLRYLDEYNDENCTEAVKFRKSVWHGQKRGPLKEINSMFANYRRFATDIRGNFVYGRGVKRQNFEFGILPGDFRYALTCKSIRVGLIGLNSAWKQYKDDNGIGKITVDRHQIEYFQSRSKLDFQRNHINILIQHHPEHWLDEADKWRLRVAGEENCDIVLSGHVHKHDSRISGQGSLSPIKLITSKSFCGLEYVGQKKEKRDYGYTIGKVTLDNGVTRFSNRMRTQLTGNNFFSDDPEGERGATPWVIPRFPTKQNVRKKRSSAPNEAASSPRASGAAASSKPYTSQIGRSIGIGHVSLLYRLNLWLQNQQSRLSILDRPEVFLSMSALEYVVSTLQKAKITPKGELFAQVLLSFPLEDHSVEALEGVFVSARKVLSGSSGIRTRLMKLIRCMLEQNRQHIVGKSISEFYDEVSDSKHFNNQNPSVKMLCASVALGAAGNTSDSDVRRELLDVVHGCLEDESGLLAYHMRGYAYCMAGNFEEAMKQWHSVTAMAATQQAASSLPTTELIGWARLEVSHSASVNVRLVPFQIALREELGRYLDSIPNFAPKQRTGPNWAREFSDWCVNNSDDIVSALALAMDKMTTQQKQRLQQNARELRDETDPRRHAADHDEDGPFLSLVSRHHAQARFIIGGESETLDTITKWEAYDSVKYQQCITKQLWNPELVMLDLVVSERIRSCETTASGV